MRIFAVDDERLMLQSLTSAITKTEPSAEVIPFTRSTELLSVMEKEVNKPDIVFLDIEMPAINGIELSKKIKDISPTTNIIFVTGFSQYAIDVMDIYPSGYVMKPITEEKVRRELNNLRHPIVKKTTKDIKIQTFGNFEVFYKDTPVLFTRSKSKELLAFLVDKQGTSVTMADIGNALWTDGIFDTGRQKSLRVYIADLKKTLDNLGCKDILIKNKNNLMLDKNKVDCDLYKFLDGDLESINSYAGQYMFSYNWAVFTGSYLKSKNT